MSDVPGQNHGWGPPTAPPAAPYAAPQPGPQPGPQQAYAPGPMPTPGPAPKSGNGALIAVLAVVAGLIVVVIIGIAAVVLLAGSKDHQMTGTLKVYDLALTGEEVGQPCETYGGYADIAAGGSVQVTDGNGKALTTGTLGSGTFVADSVGVACSFPINVGSVPDAPAYKVQIGDRNAMSYTKAELESRGWRLDLTLGDE